MKPNNKKIAFLVLFVFALLACALPASPTVLQASVSGNAKLASSITAQTRTPPAVVIAIKTLWLRDAKGSGLTVMPNGSQMDVIYCRTVRGTTWAFGYYVDETGKQWAGFAAARYLSGACK